MDMGSLLGTRLGTILNYKRTLMSTVKGPLIRLKLTVAHIELCQLWAAHNAWPGISSDAAHKHVELLSKQDFTQAVAAIC